MYKKAVSYIRVSSKEQSDSGFSPEAQRLLLYDFARKNRFDITKEFEDVETAKSQGRREFNNMLEYVKENDIKYILVEKTDRLHRNFKDYVAIEDLVEDFDVTVFLVKENTSIGKESKSSEKLMYGMKTLIAKNFIDNLSEEVKKGQDIKLKNGDYPNGAKLGYINVPNPLNPKQQIIDVDPLNKDLIIKMYEYYATGSYSLKSLIERLTKEGYTRNLKQAGIKSGKLNKSSVSRYLQDPIYIGQFDWKGKVHKGNHTPLVSAELWNKVQQVRDNRGKNRSKKHNVLPFLYKGIFRCGECGRTVTAEKKKGRYIYYHCTKYKTACSEPYVKEETIDAELYPILNMLKLSDAGMNFVIAGLKKSLQDKREWQDKIFDELVAEQSKLRKRLDRLYEDHIDNKIDENFYKLKFKQ